MPRIRKTSNGKSSYHNLDEEIRKRAYEISQERGEGEGKEISDWLKAEKEIKEKKTETKKK